MNTVRVYRLQLPPKLLTRLKAAQMEAAQVWNRCCLLHKEARMSHRKWPGRDALQKATKGQFALHSQSVQMVVHAFLANIETTRQLRRTSPQMKMKYPWTTPSTGGQDRKEAGPMPKVLTSLEEVAT